MWRLRMGTADWTAERLSVDAGRRPRREGVDVES
jgi:hypothetical protein